MYDSSKDTTCLSRLCKSQPTTVICVILLTLKKEIEKPQKFMSIFFLVLTKPCSTPGAYPRFSLIYLAN